MFNYCVGVKMKMEIDLNETVYLLTKEDIQNEAKERLGRKLTEEEFLDIKKRLNYGIGENMLDIVPAVFSDYFKDIEN